MDCEESLSACPDLVGAQIEIVRSLKYQRFCELFVKIPVEGIDGCAVLNITRGTCTIYIGFRSTPEIRRHERAHCRGYGHTWSRTAQSYKWHPIPEVEMYSLGDHRPIGKDAGS